MKYQIYKTTNLINNKIYIGQHSCKCKNCSYMGSGNNVQKAFKKYGLKNFTKEILFEFNNFEEMNEKEAEIVDEVFVSRSDTYNLMTGGGSSGIPGEETREKIKLSRLGSTLSQDIKDKIAKSLRDLDPSIKKKISDSRIGLKRSEETRERMSKARLGQTVSTETRKKLSIINVGKNISEETRERMSKASQKRSAEISLGAKERCRSRLNNKSIIKIDPETGNILNEYYYAADIEFSSSNIIKVLNKPIKRYGFYWRLKEEIDT